jgi:hypothetical protein
MAKKNLYSTTHQKMVNGVIHFFAERAWLDTSESYVYDAYYGPSDYSLITEAYNEGWGEILAALNRTIPRLPKEKPDEALIMILACLLKTVDKHRKLVYAVFGIEATAAAHPIRKQLEMAPNFVEFSSKLHELANQLSPEADDETRIILAIIQNSPIRMLGLVKTALALRQVVKWDTAEAKHKILGIIKYRVQNLVNINWPKLWCDEQFFKR